MMEADDLDSSVLLTGSLCTSTEGVEEVLEPHNDGWATGGGDPSSSDDKWEPVIL